MTFGQSFVRARSATERGFTLVELLVGTVILLVVVTGVFTSFSVGLDLRQRCRDRTDELQTVRRLAALVRDDLRNLAPLRPNLAAEDRGLSLLRRPREPGQGGDASPRAHGGRAPAGGADPEWLLRVRYRWVDVNGSPRLRREESGVTASSPPADPLELLGYEERDGVSVPAWIRGEDLPEDRRRHDFPGVRVFANEVLRFDGDALAPSPPGVQEAPVAVSFALALDGEDARAIAPTAAAAFGANTGTPAPGAAFDGESAFALAAADVDWAFEIWLPPSPPHEVEP